MAHLFRPHRRRVVGVVVLVIATAVVGVVEPRLIRVTFDDGLFSASRRPDVSAISEYPFTQIGG